MGRGVYCPKLRRMPERCLPLSVAALFTSAVPKEQGKRAPSLAEKEEDRGFANKYSNTPQELLQDKAQLNFCDGPGLAFRCARANFTFFSLQVDFRPR